MRLCFIANPNSIHTQRLMRYFSESGHEVHLIGVSPTRKPFAPGVMPSDIAFHDLTAQINVRKLRYLVWGLVARRIVRQIRPDILHAHQVAGNGWVGAATGYHPFVVTAWGSDLLVGPERSWVHRRLAQWVLDRADYVTCVSEDLANAARALGARPDRLKVAQWGIDTSVFHPSRPSTTLRQQLDLGLGPVVLNIRALQPLYNPLDIARAVPLVLEEVPETQFIIRTYSYEPALLAQFKSVVEVSGSTEAIRYVGDLPSDDAVADLYRVSDVAVSVPSSDGAPLSVLEAMACGVSLVVSDLPSLREWISNDENGMLVPVGDVEALAASIIRLLRNPHLRTQFRQRNQHLIQERADQKTEMAKMMELYYACLERSY